METQARTPMQGSFLPMLCQPLYTFQVYSPATSASSTFPQPTRALPAWSSPTLSTLPSLFPVSHVHWRWCDTSLLLPLDYRTESCVQRT